MSSDLDELLRLLDENQNTAGSEIEHFIKHHNITPSNKKCTQNPIIYWVYLKWKATIGGEPIARNVFFKQFKRYFKPASRDSVRRYYVQSKFFLLHPDEIEQARSESRQERRWHAIRRGARKHTPERNRKNQYWRKAVETRNANRLRKKRGI